MSISEHFMFFRILFSHIVVGNVLYKMYDYTKSYTKSLICYTNYIFYEDASYYYTSYTDNRFSVFLRRFSNNGPKKFLEIMKIL